MEQAIQDNTHFIYYLFNLTAGGLYGLSLLTGLSYQFWNILIWFGLIPCLGIYLISKKTTPWLNLLSLALLTYMFAIHTWQSWFDKAVVLLNWMADIFRSDYKSMSVYVCVFFPVLAFLLLFWWCLSKKATRFYLLSVGGLSALIILFFPISNMLVKEYIKG